MTVRLEPMTPAEYDVWLGAAVTGYAQEFIDSGALPPEEAIRRAEKDFEELLTDGLDTEDHLIWTAYSGDEAVGQIWVKLRPERSPMHAFVYSLDVKGTHRRRGYGQAIMEAAIEICRERGVGTIGLNVFGHNEVARRLYDRLGFQVTSTSMQLKL